MRGSIVGVKGFGMQTCLKYFVNGYEISISSDDNCGIGNGEILRSELVIFKNDVNVTEKAFPDYDGLLINDVNGEAICKAFEWCKNN